MTVSRRSLTVTLIALVLAGIVAGVWVFSRPRKSDAQLIRELLVRAEQAAEAKDLRGIMGLVADDYSDGVYDKQTLKPVVLAGLRQVRVLKVSQVLHDLKVSGDQARAALAIDLWIDSDQPEPSMHLNMTIELRKQGRHWLVTGVSGDWPGVAEQAESGE